MKLTSLLYPVRNLEQSTAFFTERLGFTKGNSGELSLFDIDEDVLKLQALQIGKEIIGLMEFKSFGNQLPADSRSNDGWFQHLALVVDDMDAAYEQLSHKRLKHVSTFPQKLPEKLTHAAGIQAFYFREEEDRPMELISFPKDKVKEKWLKPSDSMIKGIDHTAIVVSNSDVSVRFYTEIFGFKLEGQNDNYGTEQEHLNQVFGVRLRISALSLGDGIALELLEYITPPGGRLYPAETALQDSWAVQTVIFGNLDNEQIRKINKLGGSIYKRSGNTIFMQDPDGHIIRLQSGN